MAYIVPVLFVSHGLSANTCEGVTGFTSFITITVTTQHFDKGNENIEMDMTE